MFFIFILDVSFSQKDWLMDRQEIKIFFLLWARSKRCTFFFLKISMLIFFTINVSYLCLLTKRENKKINFRSNWLVEKSFVGKHITICNCCLLKKCIVMETEKDESNGLLTQRSLIERTSYIWSRQKIPKNAFPSKFKSRGERQFFLKRKKYFPERV